MKHHSYMCSSQRLLPPKTLLYHKTNHLHVHALRRGKTELIVYLTYKENCTSHVSEMCTIYKA